MQILFLRVIYRKVLKVSMTQVHPLLRFSRDYLAFLPGGDQWQAYIHIALDLYV